MLGLDLKDEDLEEIQHEMAAMQQKIMVEVKAWMDAVKAHNKQKHLDWEKKEAEDKARKDKESKEVEEAWKTEEAWKVEAWKMEQAVSLENQLPGQELTC